MSEANHVRDAFLFLCYDNRGIVFDDSSLKYRFDIGGVSLGVRASVDSLAIKRRDDAYWYHAIIEPIGIINDVENVISNTQNGLDWYEFEIPHDVRRRRILELFPLGKMLVAHCTGNLNDVLSLMMKAPLYGGTWDMTPASLSVIRLLVISITNERRQQQVGDRSDVTGQQPSSQ